MKHWIGCSGYHYKHWKGVFYPENLPQKKWFEYYSQHFNTLELNVTFYRFPRLADLENWYLKSPENFKFSVKVPRAITHFKKFIDCNQMLADFYGTVGEGLKEKVGCILFQLPPTLVYKTDKLQQIMESIDPAYTNVVEFRHESWWNVDTYLAIANGSVTFGAISHPTLPENVILTTNTAYYRFHGVPELYKSNYSNEDLHKVATEIELKAPDNVFIYFNNDIDTAAITNAKEMQLLLI